MTHPLSRIFEPRAIAVVGASSDPKKRGYQILCALRESGFEGAVYPVNPKGGQVAGFDVVRSVDELPLGVDLAVLCTPAASAAELVVACGRRDVGAALVLAVGFGESGEAGRSREAALVRAGADAGVRVVGPNTSGLLNTATGVNLVGARGVRAGGIALLVQSGNVALALMTEVSERSWDGVSLYVGIGNQIDVGSAEVLEYLQSHEATRAVIVYLEGVRDARRWLATAARVARTKPIVALKSGRTTEGSAAARSHTGSIAGPYDRLSAGLRQAGVVEVTRTDELLHVAETLGNQPAGPPGTGIVILTDGGGHGALVADLVVEGSAGLAELETGTRERLQELLGPAAATVNPVDLAGAADADPMVFAEAVDLLLDDPAVGTVLVIGLFGGYGVRFSETMVPRETEAAIAMAEAAAASGRGLIVHSMYAAHRTQPLAELGRRGVPVVGSLDVAARCAIELQRRGTMIAGRPWSPEEEGHATPEPVATEVIAGALQEGRSALDEVEARRVLEAYGLPFTPHVEVTTAAQATAAVARLDAREAVGRLDGSAPRNRRDDSAAVARLHMSAALKLVSATVLHKSDAGGVRLGVSAGDAAEAFEAIETEVAGFREREELGAEPTRVMVSPMLRPPRLELLIGATRDPSLGPVLTVGAGGIWVEAVADVAHLVLPAHDGDVRAALDALRIGPVLGPGRGHPPVDREPIERAVRAVVHVLAAHPAVAEIELNPVFVYDDRVEPVDARIVLKG